MHPSLYLVPAQLQGKEGKEPVPNEGKELVYLQVGLETIRQLHLWQLSLIRYFRIPRVTSCMCTYTQHWQRP